MRLDDAELQLNQALHVIQSIQEMREKHASAYWLHAKSAAFVIRRHEVEMARYTTDLEAALALMTLITSGGATLEEALEHRLMAW